MYSIVRMGVAALIIATITVWSTAQASDTVVGSWRLVSWVQEDVEGKAVQTVFGDNPVGVITYTSDGHMSVFVADPKRKPAVVLWRPMLKRQTYIERWSLTLAPTALMATRSPTKSKFRGTRDGTEPINSVLSKSKIIDSLSRRRQSSVQ